MAYRRTQWQATLVRQHTTPIGTMDGAFRPLLQRMDADGFNFNTFDQDNDGLLEVVVFPHSGRAAEVQTLIASLELPVSTEW